MENTSFSDIIAISHQGHAMAFATKQRRVGNTVETTVCYNILNLNIDSAHDDLDWQTYQELPYPEELSMAGFNIVRLPNPNPASVNPTAFRVVTDQQYLYLFRLFEKRLYVNRYVLSEEKVKGKKADGNGSMKASPMQTLEPSWEVRFQRSEKPDTPLGPKDGQSFLDMGNQPFLEPVWVLPLAVGEEGDEVTGFEVQLIPTAVPDEFAWQIALVSAGRLYTFSIVKPADGWFRFENGQFDPHSMRLHPHSVFDFSVNHGDETDEVPVRLTGQPSACLYNKQENMRTANDEQLKMQHAYRYMVACRGTTVPEEGEGKSGIMVVDFAVSSTGRLAFQEDFNGAQRLVAGNLNAKNFTLQFNGVSGLDLPKSPALKLGDAFTQQCWVCPKGTTNERQYLLGADPSLAPAESPAVLYITNRLRLGVGFGDGEEFLTAETEDNVLELGSWTNVIAVYDGKAYRLFINGSEVALVGTDSFSGKKPVDSPLTVIGNGAEAKGFTGQIDELRLWEGDQLDNALEFLYKPLDTAVAGDQLIGYWPMDDGAGIHVKDRSPDGKYEATLRGARWVAGAPPIHLGTGDISVHDGMGLTVNTGMAVPAEDDLSYPLFGAIHAESKPFLLTGNDGWVHLYYRGTNDEFLAAQYDMSISRPVFGLPWAAGPATEDTAAHGYLLFTGRQAGTLFNGSEIIFEKTDTNLYTLTLDDRAGNSEGWTGLLPRADYVAAVLEERYTHNPEDSDALQGAKVFYDTAGHYHQGFLEVGDPVQRGFLQFTGTQQTGFIINELEIDATEGGGYCEVKLRGEITQDAGKKIPFGGVVKRVPTDVTLFAQVMNGLSGDYDYGRDASAGDGDAKFYRLEAGTDVWTMVLPGDTFSKATITVSGESDTECDVSITLFDADGNEKIAGSWKGIDRRLNGFIKAIWGKKNPDDNQKKVTEQVFFHYPALAAGQFVKNVGEAPAAGVRSLLSFLRVLTIQGNGQVADATVPLRIIQGVDSTGWAKKQRLMTKKSAPSSPMFAVRLDRQVTNGYPQLLTVSENGTAKAVRIKSGANGGWVDIPAPSALGLRGQQSLVAIDDTHTNFQRLNIPGPLSFEAWAYPDPPADAEGNRNTRILHFDIRNEVRTSQYMLGLQHSASLYFLEGGRLEASDKPDAADKLLFPDCKRYTVQLYVRPVLQTIDEKQSGRIFQLTFEKGGAVNQTETLELDRKGNLFYRVDGGEGESKRYALTKDIPSGVWTQITVTREKDGLAFFLDGMDGGSATAVRVPDSDSHRVLVGGNGPVGESGLSMEMEVNQFTIWKRRLDLGYIASHFNRVLQPGTDGLQLLWRLDRFESAQKIANEALATGGLYDTAFDEKQCIWDTPGVFQYAYAAVGANAVATRVAEVPAKAWVHLAAIYEPHFGVRLADRNYADCGNEDSLNVRQAVSVSAWIKPDSDTGGKQVLVSKYGEETQNQSYEVGLEDGKPYIKVRYKGVENEDGTKWEDDKLEFRLSSDTKLETDRYTHLVFTADLESQETDKGDDVESFHLMRMNIFVNGSKDTEYHGYSDESPEKLYGTVRVNDTETALNIGRTQPDGTATDQAYFNGSISDVFLWGTALDGAAVRKLHAGKEPAQEELISAWRFEEQKGRAAYDGVSSNDAVFHTNDDGMWEFCHENATLSLLVDGKLVAALPCLPGDFDGFPAPQATLGGIVSAGGAVKNGFSGYLEEIRVWSQTRTIEQITDNMYRYLTGLKPHLAGYWSFDTGSGNICADGSAYGNNGVFVGDKDNDSPYWVMSTAPVANEGPMVRNALGGAATSSQARLSCGPSAVEYADVQYDALGNSFSVLKRCYVYADGRQVIFNASGYKVGDLKMVYLGQVQTEPSLIGYVEGAPPLPSENLTKPYYLDPTKPSYFAYNNSSSITLTQQKTASFQFSGSKQKGSHLGFDTKLGGGYSKETAAGALLTKKMTKFELKVQPTLELGWDESDEENEQLTSQLVTANVNTMYNCGDWEPFSEDGMLLKNGERRFVPNNEGYALVKSATADVYTLLLEDTGSLMGITTVPNTEIPPDINLIYFPLNPAYVKNGTLDGKVGLKNDPHYKNADVERGSYFKPAEAYALKRQIERQEQQALAQYQQFDAKQRGKDRKHELGEEVKGNRLYDWDSGAPKKDMFCTHVWTAAGGLYREQQGYVSQLQESYGGSYSFNWSLGLKVDNTMTFGGPTFWGELALNGGTHIKYQVNKSKEQTSALSLDIHADPDGYLNKYLGNGDPKKPFFSSKPEPGKVDTFRFMTFYLAPGRDHFSEFFDRVVDPEWLNLSNDPRAAALREARSNENQAWRVLHRVTYVSRIAPEFDVAPKAGGEPPTMPPPNIQANELLLRLVNYRLSDLRLAGHYSPAQIGKAVKDVMDKDLASFLPLWVEFLERAKEANTPEFECYHTLYDDMVAYADGYYATAADELDGE